MSSLYRCRARVGYRPSGSEKLIVFEEKQIQELNVKLKWKPNMAFANADSSTQASISTNALSASTCSVTISDPYLTGLAWPVLFDAASLYTQAQVFAANNILLPPCAEGQDPYVDKCYKPVDTETDEATSTASKFPFLILSLWYDVKGTSFGSDFYFRVGGLSISHGSRYPSVTIRGQEARSIIFNQSLVNISLDEGLPIDKALKDLAEDQGYSVSFCSNTNDDPSKKRVLPRMARYTGVTVDEAIKKVLDSVNGNFLSLPTREYANKISMCARGEINQGCSVFYLGKGLYESFEINGQPELSIAAANAESGSNVNNADPYVSEAFKASSYLIGDVAPNKRKKAMEKVKKLEFPGLFKAAPKHIKKAPTTTGYVWMDEKGQSSKTSGITVINEEASNVQKNGLNLFGTAPNGTTAISFLNGVVEETGGGGENGGSRVVIKTNFSLQVCEKEGSKKCFFRQVFQESTGLTSIKVKARDEVKISQEIGSSTADKPEFVRFYIMGHNNQFTTLNPKLVWDWAFPKEEVPKTQTPAVNSGTSQQRASGQQQQVSGLIGRVGSTGRSTGPHVHVEAVPRDGVTESQLDTLVAKYVSFSGKSRGRGFSGHGYPGIDYPAPEGTPITIGNGATVVGAESTGCAQGDSGCGGGFGNSVIIKTPEGVSIRLAHLKESSVPPNIAGLTTSSGGGKNKPTISGAPATQGLTMETGFKGVPRALRIIPGRTILSFITNYDEWVEQGRPANLDPGIWIAGRFKNWFVNECDYRWREGDLRVQIEGVSAWGTQQTRVPTFDNYLKSMRDSGDANITKNYYDYIRSLGGLNWKLPDGKDSTETYCPEAQQLSQFLSEGNNSTSPADTQGSYPQGDCKTGDSAKDSIINALYSAGLKTPNAFAGALGNLQEESGFNPNVHNTSIQGFTCVTDSSNPPAGRPEKCYGLVQWGGERKVKALAKCGQTSTLQCQLEFVVQEIKQRGGGLVEGMNAAGSASAAAEIWRRKYEVASGGIAKRQQFAEQIVKQIKCAKPS